MRTIAIFGITNSGKTTFIEQAEQIPGVMSAQVGKEFRRRYPPEYFKGQGAPSHTEAEALQILDDFTAKAREAEAKVLLIDGQPRRTDQVRPILDRFPQLEVFWMQVGEEEARQRALARNTDPAAIALSMERLINDRLQLWPVLEELIFCGVPISPIRNNFESLHYLREFCERTR